MGVAVMSGSISAELDAVGMMRSLHARRTRANAASRTSPRAENWLSWMSCVKDLLEVHESLSVFLFGICEVCQELAVCSFLRRQQHQLLHR